MIIAIVDTLGSAYDGSTLDKRGLGGSESAVISISRELVELGHTVYVYNDCESRDAKPGVYDGVSYLPRSYFGDPNKSYHVVISSRSVFPFIHNQYPSAKKVLWMHDTFTDGDHLLEGMVVRGQIDEVWTLSDWHTTYITTADHGHKRMPEVLKRKIWQTRNGINLYNSYIDIQNKNKNLYVWNASVTKGLKTCLEDVWPLVRDVNPVAQLEVIGGYYLLNNEDQQKSDWHDLYNRYHDVDGIQFRGVISQRAVSSILEEASYLLYPQSLPETFGISTLEALAHGVTPITGRFGALEEIAIEGASYLMDYPVDSNSLYQFDKKNHLAAFNQLIIQAQEPYLWQQKSNKGLIVRDICTWDTVAIQWDQHLHKLLGKYMSSADNMRARQINQRYKEVFNTRWSNDEDHLVTSEYEKRINIIVPYRNAKKYIFDCIDSIAAQDYSDYYVWLIDDASDDKQDFTDVEDYIFQRSLNYNFDVARNTHSLGALSNQMTIINELLDSPKDKSGIIVLIDGDDKLENDPYILKKINRLYTYEYAEFTYGSCWSEADNIPLIAEEYPPEVKKNKSYREHKLAWNIPYTHLRTFSAASVSKLDDSLLRDSDGRYYRAGGDSALFYALLDVVNADRVIAVRDVWYRYNDKNPNCDFRVNGSEQTSNANKILYRGPELKRNKKILIAIPTAQGIKPETFKSIYDLEVPEGYETDFQFFYGYCIDQIRNLIANWAVHKYDYLFAVDYDMEFPADTLKKFLKADKDMISGLYRQRRSEVIYEAYYKCMTDGAVKNYGPFTLRNTHSLVKVDGVGFGCVLVKSHVLAEVGYPQFVYHHALEMKDTVSEDLDFCTKATEKGFEIWLDPSVKCIHHGSSTFEV